jgi:hypothetical protein
VRSLGISRVWYLSLTRLFKRNQPVSLGLIVESLIGYVPELLLRWAFHLPFAPLAAVHSFQMVTKQLMNKKEKDLVQGDRDKRDLLNIIRMFQLRFGLFSDESSCWSVWV